MSDSLNTTTTPEPEALTLLYAGDILADARHFVLCAQMAVANIGDVLTGIALCFVVTALLCALEPRLRHWFVFPVAVCGILVSLDALPWLRGRRDLFDPIGIIGALGLHFFFLAPLLHVYWDHWLAYVVPPPDWRPWLGAMALLNVVGLLMYRAIITRRMSQARTARPSQVWHIDRPAYFAIGTVLVIVTALLQAWVYVRSGGLSGYIEVAGSGPQAFAGMGWLFVISESAPIIGMMLFAVASDTVALLRRPVVIGLAVAVFLALLVLFGGLRGSRSNSIWALFWAAGIVHYRIRSLSRPIVATGLVTLVAFMYFYGFYKSASTDAQWAFGSRADRLALEARTGRTLQVLLLADLARSDVQALELYRLTEAAGDYQLAWGRTYLGDLAVVIPEWLWPSRPETKVLEGTNLLYGANAFRPGTFWASNLYGITGELMLNFGPAAVPLGFVILGFFVVTLDRAFHRWTPEDARWLVAPVFVILSFLILVSDGDNVVFFLIKSLSVPAAVVMVSTRRIQLARKPDVRLQTGRLLRRANVPALQ